MYRRRTGNGNYLRKRLILMDDDIVEIRRRNAKVEADKAWETSWTRRLFITTVTYIIAVIYMKSIGISDPHLGALVPTGGYLLSTLSLPILKKIWLDQFYNKGKQP